MMPNLLQPVCPWLLLSALFVELKILSVPHDVLNLRSKSLSLTRKLVRGQIVILHLRVHQSCIKPWGRLWSYICVKISLICWWKLTFIYLFRVNSFESWALHIFFHDMDLCFDLKVSHKLVKSLRSQRAMHFHFWLIQRLIAWAKFRVFPGRWYGKVRLSWAALILFLHGVISWVQCSPSILKIPSAAELLSFSNLELQRHVWSYLLSLSSGQRSLWMGIILCCLLVELSEILFYLEHLIFIKILGSHTSPNYLSFVTILSYWEWHPSAVWNMKGRLRRP